jgi:hypothetical protein
VFPGNKTFTEWQTAGKDLHSKPAINSGEWSWGAFKEARHPQAAALGIKPLDINDAGPLYKPYRSSAEARSSALSTVPSHVEYFGWYHDTSNETHQFSNLDIKASASDAVVLKKQTGRASLLDAYTALWKRNETTKHLYLRPDYKATVERLATVARALLANKVIVGFNLGDELAWACLPPSELSTGAAELRSHFPRGSAIIWYNEASGSLDPTSRWRVPRPWGKANCPDIREPYRIPKALDWFSVDIYRALSNDSKWVTSDVKSFYETRIFPGLADDQRVVLVPGSFGCNDSLPTCNSMAYDMQSAEDANDFVAWAAADKRVAAVFPWHWAPCSKCNSDQSAGTRDMPLTSAVWKKFGRSIKEMTPTAVVRLKTDELLAPLTIDAARCGRTYEGIGALLNSDAPWLTGYPPKQLAEILDILFRPKWAAAMQVLKLEIGGDGHSTINTESSHMHTEHELPSFRRGWVLPLLREAVRRNPDLKVSPGRHCHFRLSLDTIDGHSLGIYTDLAVISAKTIDAPGCRRSAGWPGAGRTGRRAPLRRRCAYGNIRLSPQ